MRWYLLKGVALEKMKLLCIGIGRGFDGHFLVHWTKVLGFRWLPLCWPGVANEPLASEGVTNEPLHLFFLKPTT